MASPFDETPTSEDTAGDGDRGLDSEMGGAEASGVRLVELVSGGDATPLYFISDRGGSATCFEALATRLGEARSAYGLELPEPATVADAGFDDVAGVAEAMIAQLRARGAESPFLLAGYAFGGLVAFEMARRLTLGGDAAPYVALLEAPAPGARPRRPFHERSLIHLRRLVAPQSDVGGHYLERILRLLSDKGLRPEAGTVPDFEICLPGKGRPLATARERVRDGGGRIAGSYVPQPWDGQVHVFRGVSGRDWMAFMRLTQDYGWGKLARGGVAVHEIPGAPSEILLETHVDALAERLRQDLEEVDRKLGH